MSTPLDIRAGDSAVITTEGLPSRLWQVEQCSPRGILLRPQSGGDAQTWTHEEVFAVFAAGGLTHYPGPSRNADPRIDGLRTRVFDSFEPHRRRRAQRRLAYVKEADRLMHAGHGQVDACKAAAQTIHAQNIEAWQAEERDAAIKARALAEQRPSRRPIDPDAPLDLPKDLAEPSWSSVRVWLTRWLANGRDVRVLVPFEEQRGNRMPRHPMAAVRQRAFEEVISHFYFNVKKPAHKRTVYGEYEKACEAAGVTSWEEYSVFCKKIKKQYSERREFEKRHGRIAALLKFGVFEPRTLPDFALEEVQVDHCLIDVFVLPPGGGPPVRPWLSAIIDTATRMFLGIHIGFTPPSYACLQRCIAHAIWPKDLSAFPDIENDWPACGVFDLVLADNGLDFLCASLREAEAALDFEVMNLPIRSPWLKGVIERIFRTFNTAVFDLADGKVLQEQNKLEPYNAARHATWTLDELCYRIVRFIVDEYHVQEHPRIRATPLQRWRDLTALKAVRLPPSPDLIIPLTGEIWRRKVGAKGVEIKGLTYLDRTLFTAIRAERGGRERLWDFRRDPFDIGQIHFLYKGVWRHVDCTTPQAAVGVSRFQHRMHVSMAKHLAGEGQPVTDRHLLHAQALVAAQAQELKGTARGTGPARRQARYHDQGAYVTGLAGHDDLRPNEDREASIDGTSKETASSNARSQYKRPSRQSLDDWMKEWDDG